MGLKMGSDAAKKQDLYYKIVDGWYREEREKPEPVTNDSWVTAKDTFLIDHLKARDDHRYPNPKRWQRELHFRYIRPYFNNILTDITSTAMTSQYDRTCGPMEIKAMECIDYYGTQKGLELCKDYYDDFMECTFNIKQSLRVQAMLGVRARRWHEWIRGHRDYSTVYEKLPKPHAFEKPAIFENEQP